MNEMILRSGLSVDRDAFQEVQKTKAKAKADVKVKPSEINGQIQTHKH